MPRGEPLDPNRTRPPYWPARKSCFELAICVKRRPLSDFDPDVIHREPDHIGRDGKASEPSRKLRG